MEIANQVRERRSAWLTRDAIVRAAIAVADAEGAAALGMRRIARELDCGTMSLYKHVPSKDALLDLMLDALWDEIASSVPAPVGEWRADLRAIACSHRSLLLAHAWMMDFIGSRRSLGPGTLRLLERAMAVLDGLGLETAVAISMLNTVQTYVLGSVVREHQEAHGDTGSGPTGTDPARPDAEPGYHERLRASGRYPHLAQMIEDGVDPDAPQARDERFGFGLECMLAGFEATLGPFPRGAQASAGA
jgi:AcrR family transcriptional regulator